MKTFCQLIFLLVVSCILSCRNTATFTISGSLDSANATKVRLVSMDFKKCYDSAYIVNKKFKLHSTVSKGGFYWLDFLNNAPWGKFNGGWGHSCLIFIENNSDYHFDSMGPNELLYNRYTLRSSSYTQNKLNEFNLLDIHNIDSLSKLKRKCLNIINNLTDKPRLYDLYLDTLNSLNRQISLTKILTLHQYMQKNDSTIIVPYMMTQVGDFFNEYLPYKKALDNQSDEVKASEYYHDAAGLLKSVDNIFKGGKTPEIEGKALDGKRFSNDFKKHKFTLINFWASWCIPCREELPDLKKVYDLYKSKGLDIVSVSIDKDFDSWKKASIKERACLKFIHRVSYAYFWLQLRWIFFP